MPQGLWWLATSRCAHLCPSGTSPDWSGLSAGAPLRVDPSFRGSTSRLGLRERRPGRESRGGKRRKSNEGEEGGGVGLHRSALV